MKRKVAEIVVFVLVFVGFISCGEDNPEIEEIIDLPIELTAKDTSFVEGDTDFLIDIPLFLNQKASKSITVTFQIKDSTAFEPFDYSGDALQGFVTFAEGDSIQSIQIEINGDNVNEGNEVFYVVFSYSESGETFNIRSVITIIDDDEMIDNSNSGVLVIPDEGYITPLSYEGMNLVWQDEFEGSDINMSNWTFEIGDGCPNLCGWGNQELQYYRAENASIQEGNLIIEAKSERFGGRNYTSTRMITKEKQSFKYGRVDIRANVPFGKGVWPALWMLGDNIDEVGWPACGEIDIMEMIGGSQANESTVHGTVHWQDDGFKADFGGSYRLTDGSILNDKFHVYSIIWDEQKIVWYIDDIKYHEINITGEFFSEFQESFFFIFNIAVGGIWPGSPTPATVFPQYMIVDYIRVFQDQ